MRDNLDRATSKADTTHKRLARLHRLVQGLCGLYSRVGNRLNVDRSYVSRVARGERHSEKIERALLSEFERIEQEQHLR